MPRVIIPLVTEKAPDGLPPDGASARPAGRAHGDAVGARPASSAPTRRPAAGSRKLSVPTATQVAPAARKSAASRPEAIPPMPITGIATRSATACDLLQRDRAHGRPRHAPGAAAEPRPSAARVERHALERVDQRHRVGPGRPRPPPPPRPARRRSGVSLTTIGTVGERAHALHRAGRLARIRAHHEPALHVRARHVQLHHRHLGRSPTRATSAASSSRLNPITETTSGTGSSAELRQVVLQEALQALVRAARSS